MASTLVLPRQRRSDGLEYDPELACRHLSGADPQLGELIDRVGEFGLRPRITHSLFTSLLRSIVYQQLSGKAAETIFKRFGSLAGDPLTPEGILKLSDEQLRGVGLSKQKSAYLKDLAQKTAAGVLDFSKLPELPDEEVIEHLTQVKGIGVWTAHMFLIFSLRRLNVLPTGDYGVQMALKRHYRKRKLPKPKDMEKIARAWEPYRSVACWYMWRSLDIKTL